jgi:flagellar hook-associated protein 2
MSSTSATSNPVSVASSSSAGAAGGSVINVSALVSQLVTATQVPQQNLITAQTQAVTTQISALGTLKSALSTFQKSLGALDSADSFNAETASSSNADVFTSTTTTGAPVGTYSITVGQLASAQQLLSKAFTGTGTTQVGTGSLQISLGSTSFNVNVSDTDNTLAGIASAINTASGNPGVTATIIQGTDGAHLLLSSSQTGAANTIQVSETDGGSALSALTHSSGDATNYTEQSQALDAEYSISGVPATNSSNTIPGAINGVTLTLTGKTAANTPATLTVSTSTATIESNVAGFVSAYNSLASTFSSLSGFDSTTGSAGPMMGNALLSSIQNSVRSALYGIVNTGSSTYNSLASIGITSNQDGTISLDSGKLQTALSTNFSAVSQLFSSSGGVATKLNSQLNTQLAAKTGVIAQNSTSLTNQSNALDKKSQALSDQMTALSASLTQQYSALNTLLSSLQTTSSYLTQAFASLPLIQSKSG